MIYPRLSAIIAGLIGLTLQAGCGGRITPPAYVDQPTTVYLKLDARHSGVILPRSENQYVEYSFGAFRWSAYADTRWPVAVSSMLGFMTSTLQTNELPVIDGRPRTIAEVALIPITVDRRRADALRVELDARFRRQRDTFVYNESYDMNFVEDSERYWVFNNCNQVTARWLRRLGCRVEGLTVSNELVLSSSADSPRRGEHSNDNWWNPRAGQ